MKTDSIELIVDIFKWMRERLDKSWFHHFHRADFLIYYEMFVEWMNKKSVIIKAALWFWQFSSLAINIVEFAYPYGYFFFHCYSLLALPGSSDGKESACNARDRFDPWVRKIPWRSEWQLSPIFLLENPMDRGAWRTTVHGVTKSWTRLRD